MTKPKRTFTKAVGSANAAVKGPFGRGIFWVGFMMAYLAVFLGFQSVIQSNEVFNLIMTLGGLVAYQSMVVAGFVILLVICTIDITVNN